MSQSVRLCDVAITIVNFIQRFHILGCLIQVVSFLVAVRLALCLTVSGLAVGGQPNVATEAECKYKHNVY